MSLQMLGGIAAGINKGMDMAQQDEERKLRLEAYKSDRAFQDEQRNVWRSATARKRDEWKREDEAAASTESLMKRRYGTGQPQDADAGQATTQAPSTAPVEDPGLQPSGAVTTPVRPQPTAAQLDPNSPAPTTPQAQPSDQSFTRIPLDLSTPATSQPKIGGMRPRQSAGMSDLDYNREMLQTQVKARKYDQAAETQKRIDGLLTDADRQVYSSFASALPHMDLGQAVTEASKILSSDGTNLMASEPRENKDGSFSVTLRNRYTNIEHPVTVKDKDQLSSLMQQHLDYSTYAAGQKAQRDAKLKVWEEQAKEDAKTINTPAGSISTRRDGSQIVNTNGFIPTINADGTTSLVRPGSPGSSTGAGAGKTPPSSLATAQELVKKIMTESEDKFTIEQRTLAEDHLARILTERPNTPPATAARVATAIARNPALVQPEINVTTGQINNVFSDPQLGEFVIQSNVGNALSPPPGVKREVMQSKVRAMLDAQPKAVQPLMVKAAFDKKGDARRELEDAMRQDANAKIEAAMKQRPEQAQAIKERASQMIQVDIDNMGRKLDLLANYSENPDKKNEPGFFERAKKTAAERLGNKGYGMSKGPSPFASGSTWR